jgi:hypothetical protein
LKKEEVENLISEPSTRCGKRENQLSGLLGKAPYFADDSGLLGLGFSLCSSASGFGFGFGSLGGGFGFSGQGFGLGSSGGGLGFGSLGDGFGFSGRGFNLGSPSDDGVEVGAGNSFDISNVGELEGNGTHPQTGSVSFSVEVGEDVGKAFHGVGEYDGIVGAVEDRHPSDSDTVCDTVGRDDGGEDGTGMGVGVDD